MRSVMFLVVLAFATSCASSGSPSASGIVTLTERVVTVDTQGANSTSRAFGTKAHIPVSPSRVFAALKSVYEEMGVAPAINDPTTGHVGNTDFWKTRKLGTEPISAYLECGTSITGPAADTHRINISVISQVRPDGKGETELETALSALARSMDGATSDRACGTTGLLEQRIRQRLLDKLSVSEP